MWFFFCDSAIDLFQLNDMCLIDILFDDFGCNSFGIGDAMLQAEILPDAEERVDIFPLLHEEDIIILFFPERGC